MTVERVCSFAQRREFLTQFIEKVEIYEEEQENGQWLKSIEFKLPIISKDMKISLDNGSQIESIALLQRMSNTRSKEITLDVDMEDYYRIKGDRTND